MKDLIKLYRSKSIDPQTSHTAPARNLSPLLTNQSRKVGPIMILPQNHPESIHYVGICSFSIEMMCEAIERRAPFGRQLGVPGYWSEADY